VRARLMKEIEAPLADLLASGGIPEGSRVWVDVTGDDDFGHDLAFFYEPDDLLLQMARERRARQAQTQPLKEKEAAMAASDTALAPMQPIDLDESD